MKKIHLDDTIAAIATAPGEGAIALIRLSGSEACRIAGEVFRSRSGRRLAENPPLKLLFGSIYSKINERLDDVLAVRFEAPRSYTGEDMVEISCHGGVCSSRRVLERILEAGARLASPGEFTRRAFLAGKLDLVQAEAVSDTIRAKTDASLREAERQLAGELSKRLKELRGALLGAYAEMEATLDFPEEDKEVYESAGIRESLKRGVQEIEALLATSHQGALLREGFTVAIAGKPNAGKSSLLNALVKHERAIVTDIPGTTRDTIEEWVEMDGFPVKLIDTAGITETRDEIERLGIERAHKAIRDADLVIFCFDGSGHYSAKDGAILEHLPKTGRSLVVLTKSDLALKFHLPASSQTSPNPLRVSARRGEGLEELERAILSAIRASEKPEEGGVLVTNLRHARALEASARYFKRSLGELEKGVSLELIVEDLRSGLNSLGEIVGEVYTEELLDTIFSRFCIGK